MRTHLFDLDGTLIDSDADIAAAANAARGALGLAPLPVEAVARWIGRGSTYLLRNVLPDASSEAFRAARARFVEHYAEHLLVHTRPHPGAEAVLSALAGRAGLVTNKPRRFVDAVLEGLGWRRYFATTVAGDTLPERKPDPAPIRRALADLGLDSAPYVGDSEVDRAAASAAGVPFIAVAWGRVDGEPRVADLRQVLEL